MKADRPLQVSDLSNNIFLESTKFTNKEFRNARNYYNLYDHSINTKWKDLKDRERLGIRRVNNLPPLDINNGMER